MPRVTPPLDRPSRLKLLLRRQRKLLRPAAGVASGVMLLLVLAMLVRSADPAGMNGLRERIGNLAPMRVTAIVIEGRANTPEPLLRAALGVSKGDRLLGFSLERARQRIEGLAWVEHATVERQLPGTILVRLAERRPFAIWQKDGRFALIDRAGQVVSDENLATFKQLPLVVGAGAPEAAAGLLDALETQPGLSARMVAAVRVGERRWNLRLNNGIDILLPEGAESQALAKLAELQASNDLLDRPLQIVDLRLPDRLVIRPAADRGNAPTPPPAAKAADGRRPT